jgi:hypothetical protein
VLALVVLVALRVGVRVLIGHEWRPMRAWLLVSCRRTGW